MGQVLGGGNGQHREEYHEGMIAAILSRRFTFCVRRVI